MVLVAVGVATVLVTVVALLSLRAIGVHAGRVEASLAGVVGVAALFVALPTSVGVRVGVFAVRVAALTVVSTGGKREGKQQGQKGSEDRGGPAAIHGVDWSWFKKIVGKRTDYGSARGRPIARRSVK
jgi:hypothetical protein